VSIQVPPERGPPGHLRTNYDTESQGNQTLGPADDKSSGIPPSHHTRQDVFIGSDQIILEVLLAGPQRKFSNSFF
jgi:hypothetical protein